MRGFTLELLLYLLPIPDFRLHLLQLHFKLLKGAGLLFLSLQLILELLTPQRLVLKL